MRNLLLFCCLVISMPAFAEVTAQPGKGIVLATEDQDFVLKVRPRIQLRYTGDATWPEGQPEYEQSFLIRRARLAMTGNMFGKDTTFKLELAFSPRDVGYVSSYEIPTLSPLLDFYVQFNQIKNISIRAGQYKVPFSRQRVTSSGDLQMVDRSLAQGEFNQDRDIGVDARSKDLFGLNMFRYYVGIYAGQGRDNFQAQSLTRFMALARVEFLPFGLCDDYKEGSLGLEKRPCLSLASAYAFLPEAENDRGIKGSIPSDLGTTSIHVGTLDSVFKWYGTSLFGELYGRYGMRVVGESEPFEEARNGFGGTLQIGQMIFIAPVEVSARYSFIRSTVPFLVSSLDAADEAGFGISWYPGDHSLKFQADIFKTWSDMDFWSNSLQGRLQVQAAF